MKKNYRHFVASSLDEEAEKMYGEEYDWGQSDMGRADEATQSMTADELYQYGLDSRDGKNGRIKMPTTAVKYLKAAAEKGHIDARYELARMYEKGIGSEVDMEQAIRYYNSAANYGHRKAKRAAKRLEKRAT